MAELAVIGSILWAYKGICKLVKAAKYLALGSSWLFPPAYVAYLALEKADVALDGIGYLVSLGITKERFLALMLQIATPLPKEVKDGIIEIVKFVT